MHFKFLDDFLIRLYRSSYKQVTLLLVIVLLFSFYEKDVFAQGESVALSITFDEPDSLFNQLNVIAKTDFAKTTGANNKGIQLKTIKPLNLSSISELTTDFSLFFWFQLDKDSRSKQTLFFAQDSLSFFTVYIKNGALSVQYTDFDNKLVAHHKFLPSLSVEQWQVVGLSVSKCRLNLSIGCDVLIDEQLNSSLFERRLGKKDIFIGSDNINSAFKGKIDELMLFKQPLTPIQFKWFCSKNFLESYLPINTVTEVDATEPQTNFNNNMVAGFNNNSIIGSRVESIQAEEFQILDPDSSKVEGKTFPMGLSHFTIQLDVFLESMTKQELLAIKSIDENQELQLLQNQDSIEIKMIDNNGSKTQRIYAGLKELQQNLVTLEFECCTIRVYNNCTLQEEAQTSNFISSKTTEIYRIGLFENTTLKKVHYLPYIKYGDTKQEFICKHQETESNVPTNDSTQVAIKELFDTRKSYIKQEPIEVTTKKVLLSFWDFDRVDGDTVSALFNDEVILEYYGLTHEKVTKMVELDDSEENVLKLYAHSDGSEGNNTVKVGILSGGGYYQEVDISTESLLNGGILLKYKPK